MEDLILTKEELHELFIEKKILDTKNGWYYNDREIQIIAIHDIEKKYIQNMMNAEHYKIKFI